MKAFWSGLFSYSLIVATACITSREGMMRRNGNARNFCVSYSSGRTFYRPELNPWKRLLYEVWDIWEVCKNGFSNWNTKIAFLRAFIVITYYNKLFRTGADRHNGILVTETISGIHINHSKPRTYINYIVIRKSIARCVIKR